MTETALGPILLLIGAATLAITAAFGLKDVRANARLDRDFEDFIRDPDAPRDDDLDPRDLFITNDDVPDHLTDPVKRLEHAITRISEYHARTPSDWAHGLALRKLDQAAERLVDLGDTGTLTTTRGARVGLREYRA